MWRLAGREAINIHAVIDDVQLLQADAIRLGEMLPIVVRTRHNSLCSPQLFWQQELFAPDVVRMCREAKWDAEKSGDDHGTRGGAHSPVGVEMVHLKSLNGR